MHTSRLLVLSLLSVAGISRPSPGQCNLTALGELRASDAEQGDRFGYALAISETAILVGSPSDDAVCEGCVSGSAYVFRKDRTGWYQEAKLVPDGANQRFGESVAIEGNTAVIGANSDNSFRGAAYVFKFESGAWTQRAKLVSNDISMSDRFGAQVAISNGILAISATGDSSGRGSVYVFVEHAFGWLQEAKIEPADTTSIFGNALHFKNDFLVVGAAQDSESASNSGAAYLFQITVDANGVAWTQQEKLKPINPIQSERFGSAIAALDDCIVVGAPINNLVGPNAGVAYVFRHSGGTWFQEARIFPDDAAPFRLFGSSVAVGSGLTVSGSSGDGLPGRAYLFRGTDGQWVQESLITSTDVSGDDDFGASIGLLGDTLVVGNPNDDQVATNAGSVSIFLVGGNDCNANGVPDVCDIANLTSNDCQQNGIPDECDLDHDNDGVPDECDNCPIIENAEQTDEDSDGIGDACDCSIVRWGDVSPCGGNGAVDLDDILAVLRAFSGRADCPSVCVP